MLGRNSPVATVHPVPGISPGIGYPGNDLNVAALIS